jgi:hypothetical protein
MHLLWNFGTHAMENHTQRAVLMQPILLWIFWADGV